ncbi:MAG: AtpZ/AtpI family protein [Chitinophagales bacterium]|nr:AtpZ/AtpI family protein [Chitinophagales bacterium]
MSEPQQDPSSRKKPLNDYVKYSALGFQMMAIIGVGVGLGYLIDSKWGKPETNTFTIIFSLLFVVGSMVWVIMQLLRDQK